MKINQGQTIIHKLNLSTLDRQVTFLINWQNQSSDMKLILKTPNGTLIDTSIALPLKKNNFGKPILYKQGANYKFFRLNFPLQGSLNNQWEGEWEMQVSGTTVPSEEDVALSAYASAPIHLDSSSTLPMIETGDDIILSTRISELDLVVSKLKANAILELPQQSIGNLMSTIKISDHDLKKFMEKNKISSDTAGNKEALKIQYLIQMIKDKNLIPYKKSRIKLYDDGKHQDGTAGDGIFANTMSRSKMPGLYNIQYRIEVKKNGHKKTGKEKKK